MTDTRITSTTPITSPNNVAAVDNVTFTAGQIGENWGLEELSKSSFGHLGRVSARLPDPSETTTSDSTIPRTNTSRL